MKFGNYIADSVKGNKYNKFPDGIQFGIVMHRRIDEFTDNNSIVKSSMALLKSVYGRYSGVAVDILYDHFLASQWQQYSDIDLFEFEADFYKIIRENYKLLPKRMKRFSYYFIKRKRLAGYASITEIFDVLNKMGIYTSFPKINGDIRDLVLLNYKQFNEYFNNFFPQLIDFSNKFLEYRHFETAKLLKIDI
ncbi:MAG: ACP phosphodiesterase [Bacteroidota bacterium]|nr:ACP phosphodiesterase [Bacteroidota bacterium]